MSDLIAIARKHRSLNLRTHYEGCEADHIECLVVKLADEVERQNRVIDKLVKEIEESGSSPCMGHLR
jgi:hypothetical protein